MIKQQCPFCLLKFSCFPNHGVTCPHCKETFTSDKLPKLTEGQSALLVAATARFNGVMLMYRAANTVRQIEGKQIAYGEGAFGEALVEFDDEVKGIMDEGS